MTRIKIACKYSDRCGIIKVKYIRKIKDRMGGNTYGREKI
jgi:hypothetical protein